VVDGRPYELQVPAGASGTPLPLVLLLHGYSANGFAQNIVFPFSNVVDSRRFLYALPDGTRDGQDKRFWNATDACCNFEKLAVDDVGFLRAVIADVEAHEAVDPSKVFIVGHSNGAFMALRMACEASDVVKGVVSVAGAADQNFPACPGPPIPVLQIHGLADATIKYDGGTTSGGSYPGAITTTGDFAARNGCAPTRSAQAPLDLIGDATAETTRETYDGCPADAGVELWSIAGAGHVPAFDAAWPGRVIDWLTTGAP
jgi:polyhydroxybutyrate depolymerase